VPAFCFLDRHHTAALIEAPLDDVRAPSLLFDDFR
jgi:hypothetical protein